MVGPSLDEARHVVEQVVSQVQGMLPETLELGDATLIKGEPGARSNSPQWIGIITWPRTMPCAVTACSGPASRARR
jgi:hypothetical protein